MLSILFVLCYIFVNPSLAEFDPTQHENWNLLDHRICGVSKSASRIVGGTQAYFGEFPWIAGIIHSLPDGSENIFACVGTVINRWTILTSAYCVALPEEHYVIEILLGDWNKDSDPDCENDHCVMNAVSRASEILIHSDYNEHNLMNDIALIRVRIKIEFSAYVRPICMMKGALMERNFLGVHGTVAGWGVTDPNINETSQILLKVNVQVQENDYCINAVQRKHRIGPNQMCVGTVDKQLEHRAACFGDSGGPLMIVDAENNDPRAYVIGIVSHGRYLCGDHASPDVYTRIASYMEWILDNLKESTRDFKVVFQL